MQKGNKNSVLRTTSTQPLCPVEDVKNIIFSPHSGQHILLALKAALAPTINQIQTLNPAVQRKLNQSFP